MVSSACKIVNLLTLCCWKIIGDMIEAFNRMHPPRIFLLPILQTRGYKYKH